MKLRKILAAAAAAVTALSMTAFSVSAEEIWSGSQDLGTSWDGSKAVILEVASAAAGDEVVVNFTCADSADYYNLQLCTNTDGWPKLTAPEVNEWGSIDVGGMSSYSFTLNDADAAAITSTGLVVFGYAVTITSVEINGAAAPAAETAPAADSTSSSASTGNAAAASVAAVMAVAGAAAVASRKRK